jgi:hypothetical protein
MQDSLWGTPRRSESWRQAQSGRSFHKHRFVATSRLPCAISRTGTTVLISTGTCFALIMKYIHTVHPPGQQNININIVLHKVWSSVQSLWHSTLCLYNYGDQAVVTFFVVKSTDSQGHFTADIFPGSPSHLQCINGITVRYLLLGLITFRFHAFHCRSCRIVRL